MNKQDVKNSRVPLPLCIFFVIFLGLFAIVPICFIPAKVKQYRMNKNLIEIGEIVEATFDDVWIGTGYEWTYYWQYSARYVYEDENGVKYSVTINHINNDTDLDGLKNGTVKIFIDGKGNCIRADRTKSNIFWDLFWWFPFCLFFIALWVPFIVIFIKKIRFYIYQHKLKKETEIQKYTIFK